MPGADATGQGAFAALRAGGGRSPSWLFIEDGIAHSDCDALVQAGRRLGGLGRLAAPLRILPRGLRNWLYRRFARNRYHLFGRSDMCAIPDPAFQRRLLR